MPASPLFAPGRLKKTDFAAEWCGIAAILLLDAMLGAAIGFRVIFVWHDGLLLSLALCVMLALRGFALRRGALMAEYFGLTAGATVAFGILSYICMAHGAAPLADGMLQRIDTALGFDWLYWYRVMLAHQRAALAFQFVYNSLVYQGLYFGLLLALLDRKAQLREMFWLVFVAGLFTSAGAYLWPALGPFKEFGLESNGDFLGPMTHLRSGHNLTFALREMTGVVSFPSFHTTMALAYIYGFRRTGPIGILIAILNIGMLVTIPFFGGHYLADMIAGALVAVMSLAVVRAGQILLAPRAEILSDPVPAA
jgi:hypothetical protein